jgi:hypothetical protein
MNDDPLHDATLEEISFDWSNGVVELRLRAAAGPCVVRGVGVTKLSAPRAHPWGPSSSVNELRGPRTVGERAFLEIEMQSGDVIEIEALRFVAEAAKP